MRYRDDRPEDGGRGAPGSEDAYARGAGASGDAIAAPGDDAVGDTADRAGVSGESATGESIEDLRRQLEDQRDRHLRLAAEFDNFRKRSAKERSEAESRGQAELVKRIMDELDDLARVAHLDPETTPASAVLEGVELVERKLHKDLGALGLQIVDPVDQLFDPAVMEALTTEPALSPEDDHLVARVYQVGYVFNGQLLRPARVVVKQWNG
jgi:molecular chaperone GrpE